MGYKRRLLICGLVLHGVVGWADTERIQVGGSARVRAEFKNNSDFSDATGDYVDFTGSRFRIDMRVKATEKVGLFFQPQFTKSWGEPEFVPSGAATNTATNTSGATNDTPIDLHQGYVTYAANEALSFNIGRKELNFGDELLVGGVGWSNVGRSFDLLHGGYKHERGSIEAFSAKVEDRNTAAAGVGDRNFSGVYFANRINDFVQNADAYVFYLDDSAATPTAVTTAYGLRLKSPVGALDYRAEMTFENVESTDTTGERQYDFEVGYTMNEAKKLRVGLEHFSATGNFVQMFPTGHKWLGYADLFSRRNIQGYRARVSGQVLPGLSAALDYHRFERQDTSRSAYKFNGTTAYGTVGDSAAIAEEWDLVVTYVMEDGLTFEGGLARVLPSDYLDDNGGPDEAMFSYLQVGTSF